MVQDRQQQEQLQEKNEASTYQMEQQMRQSPGSVTQQQIDNKVAILSGSLRPLLPAASPLPEMP